LVIGARYHHERYDGKGYPDGLKGEDIPEIARIISVADAYDAMTSKRSYRDPIPQQTVREEIVKGAGTQFDPKFAKVMQHLIDLDSEYKMKEKEGVKALAGKDEFVSKKIGDVISDGIYLTPKYRTIKVKCEAAGRKGGDYRPALIMFDSLDARYHDTPNEIKDLNYFEYAKLSFDGTYEIEGARKIEVEKSAPVAAAEGLAENEYMILAVRFKDHALIRIDSAKESIKMIVALPDSARYAYIGLTGENCHLYDVDIIESEEMIDEQFIPRIAEEVSYIKGYPVGDIPSIQVDGYRTASTEGISIEDGMKIVFHTMSLPTARLVWHCSFVDVFYSKNRMPGGPEYKEYALIRLDGENWEAIETARNKLIVNKTDDFDGWESWKEANKKGYDCTVSFTRKDDVITVATENMGISIKSTINILQNEEDVYVSLTGDQCAITNIRIVREQSEEAYIEE
ncbi:MAG: diguanylate cyclase, partial [Lachnospiraceae bacterium]|nr:diguanylate cyclase [Lachnospiraceae bacterium]